MYSPDPLRPGFLSSLGQQLKGAAYLALPLLVSACATSLPDSPGRSGTAARKGQAYQVAGEWYHPRATALGYREVGKASWYGRKFHGRKTASGETYNMHLPTAAHRTLPLPTVARVTNLDNGRNTRVRINDRGPFVDTHERIIDLSYGAAKRLGIDETGLARVRVVAVKGPQATGDGAGADKPRNQVPAAANGEDATLYLQVGAFHEEGNAARLRRRLRGLDMKRVVVTTGYLGGDPVYRVRIGPLADVARADSLAQQLRGAGLPSGQLVRD
ncbi:septal ring lytic transglycosylase RlpA family protein [Thiohalorhabdus sp.]|uniref:septal ring lytic transglycosylase RlpA family protein n=1 Tax=Thiohalorhabdus sp. TaxID=3094134 RepID=UPI002FC28D12